MVIAKRKIAISLASLAVFSCVAYGVSVVARSHTLYDRIKAATRGWSTNVYAAEPELGLRLVPNTLSAETFHIGPDVPCRIDAEGFRVPLDAPDDSEVRRPLVLALGCSYTFGMACRAEDTFAERVARDMNGTCRNAGISSGGAAQMLILARRLIPRDQPDVVLAQYSPWLMNRSSVAFAPTDAGLVPTPHFVRTEEGVELHPPAFDSLTFDLPFADYKESPRGVLDFAKFVTRVGWPLLWHDDRHMLALSYERRFGSQPSFASQREIEAFVYPEIARLCRENNARLVIVWLADAKFEGSWDVPPVIAALDVPVAFGTKRMVEELPEKRRAAYNRAYTHMRGDPPVRVDGHPNPRAHELIAEEILRALR